MRSVLCIDMERRIVLSRRCAAAVMAVIMMMLAVLPVCADDESSMPAVEHAQAAILYNLENNRILYEYNASDTVYPASTVKIMTAIVAMEHCSIAEIFLERDMDYYILPSAKDCNEQVVLKGIELIKEDKYDFLVIYNGMYDSMMHATYPEAPEAMEWLVHHTGAYARIQEAVKESYQGHTTLVGYATDHGVHTNEAGRGTHGADIPEDINITHFYDVI